MVKILGIRFSKKAATILKIIVMNAFSITVPVACF